LNLKAFEVAESQIPFNHGYGTATQAPNFGECIKSPIGQTAG